MKTHLLLALTTACAALMPVAALAQSAQTGAASELRGQKERPDLNFPPQNSPVMIAQASQGKQSAAKTDRTVGICQALSNPALDGAVATAENSLTPAGAATTYFLSFENRKVAGPSKVTVLEYPKHGKLEDLGTFVTRNGVQVDTGKKTYDFIPESGYLGQDSATFLVEIGGYKLKMVYVFKVATEVDNKKEELLCPNSYWRISANFDASDNSNITAVAGLASTPTASPGA
jgi:hypothetical protein